MSLSQGPALVIPADLRDRAPTGGFDIQAYRRVSADDRAGLERLCRYLLHLPIAHDRLSLTPQGRVRVRFTRPWKNGVDATELDPFNFSARLVRITSKRQDQWRRAQRSFALRERGEADLGCGEVMITCRKPDLRMVDGCGRKRVYRMDCTGSDSPRGWQCVITAVQEASSK